MTLKEQVFEIVRRVPIGKVIYYKQISDILALEYDQFVSAQVVGWALSGMKPHELDLCPWQRVVAKNGYIAALKLGSKGLLQVEILRSEGVEIIDNTVTMHKYCLNIEDLSSKAVSQKLI
jgi:alkylated DNA nucleotide flippase Atl1